MTSDPAPAPFSAESLRQQVEGYFADVPPDHVFAQIEYRVGGTLRLETALRVGDRWKVGGSLAWNLKTKRIDEGSVRVSASWA